MTHDLVERLRKPWDGTPGSRKRRDEERMEAADKLESYMADADAHVSRLELVRRQEDEIRDLKAENAVLRGDLEQSRSVEETTHGLYQFWNKKAAELAASNDALRAEKDEIRRALEPFAKYETADGLPCGLLRAPDRHPILFNGLGDEIKIVATVGDFRRAAAAIRNMGERE